MSHDDLHIGPLPVHIDPFLVSEFILRETSKAQKEQDGYFGGFSENMVADVMRMQGELYYKPEPLDPAFNPLWAQGLPNLGIEASVYRATSNYSGRPYNIAPYQGPSFEDIRNLYDRWQAPKFEFSPEAFRVVDQAKYHELSMDLIPGSLYDEILDGIRESLRREDEAFFQRQICGAFGVEPKVVGLVSIGDSKPDTWTSRLKRRWYSMCGKARWARERFARRLYEFVSEYDFEYPEDREEVDW